MGVHVLEFTGRKFAEGSRHELHSDLFLAAEPRLHAWQGQSGRRTMHTVHTLYGCPEVIDAVYVFARRAKNGTRLALGVSETETQVPSLNLAEIRHRGALLDADEVHVFAVADGSDRQLLAADLAAGLRHEPTPFLAS